MGGRGAKCVGAVAGASGLEGGGGVVIMMLVFMASGIAGLRCWTREGCLIGRGGRGRGCCGLLMVGSFLLVMKSGFGISSALFGGL